MNRLIDFLISLERRLTSPRAAMRLHLLSWQWLRVRRPLLLGLGLMAVLGLSLWHGWETLASRHLPSEPRPGGVYREAVYGKSEAVNPLFSPANPVDQDLVQLIYSGLLRRQVDGTLAPDLAEGYEISEDRKTYIVRLRKGLHWQDGVVITSRDIIYTIGQIQDPEYRGPLTAEWRGVEARAPSDHVVTFTLETPYAFFPVGLTLPILPWHLLKDVPTENLAIAAFNDHPVGSGPFRLAKRLILEKGRGRALQEFRLERNPYYAGQAPYLDQVIIKVYGSPGDAFRAYERREVDGVAGIAASDTAEAERWRSLRLYDRTLPQYTALFFNLGARDAPVAEKTVRQALAELVDRKGLVNEALAGRGFVAYYPVLPGSIGYDPSLARVDHNTAHATALLDQAGWRRDGDRRVRGEDRLSVRLVTGTSEAVNRSAEYIKSAWEQEGISVEVIQASPDELKERYIQPREYQVLLYGINFGATGDLHPFWHSSARDDDGLNLSNYANPVADRILESARLTGDQAQVAARYIRFQQIWHEDFPAHVLFTPVYQVGIDDRIKGVQIQNLTVPADRFAGVTGWYVKERRKF